MSRENLGVQANSDDSPGVRFLSQGATSLSDRELLSLVLGGEKGVSSLSVADTLLAEGDGTLEGLRKLSAARLAGVSGVTQGVALRLAAVWALSRRVGERAEVSDPIGGSRQVEALFRPLLEDLPYEEVWMLSLSPGKRILSRNMLSRGTAKNSLIDVRLVVRLALDNMAAGVILIHNHPSGSVAPSGYDLSITKQVRSALGLFDIRLVDHLILGSDIGLVSGSDLQGYFSFAEQGVL